MPTSPETFVADPAGAWLRHGARFVRTALVSASLVSASLVLASLSFYSAARAQDAPGARRTSPPGPAVSLINIKAGPPLPDPFTARLALRKMVPAPAGFANPNTGPPHPLTNTAPPPMDQPV